MKRYDVPEISENVYWVGTKDWNRRTFDALIPLPQGTTYNAYLIKGSEKIVLIDTVNRGFEGELKEKIAQVMDLAALDYIVMNHAEPDHAGAISQVMQTSKKISLITTKKGVKMAQVYYEIPEERIRVVGDGDNIDLGGKTLKFVEAPMLHWPETMFTYLVENKVLFPCDFFGAHIASGFYDEDLEELIPFAKIYFGVIMMPFKSMGKRALEKIRDLDIEIIAPSHGPIYKNPQRILDVYQRWTAGETKEKVTVVYVSMWNSTEEMIKAIVETLLSEGIEVSLYNLSKVDVGEVAKDLVDSRAIILGAPTVIGEMHPLAIYAAHLVKMLRPPLEYGVILGSYGWGGGAVKQGLEILNQAKIEVVGTLEVKGPPSDGDYSRIIEIGKNLLKKIKGAKV